MTRYIRYSYASSISYGILDGETVRQLDFGNISRNLLLADFPIELLRRGRGIGRRVEIADKQLP